MAKTKTDALTKYDAELARYASEARAVEKNVGGGNFISLSGGRMQYQGAEVPGNEMNCIVVSHCLHNIFYEGRYDPDNRTSPVCYAFGYEDDEMAPHEQSSKPQSSVCTGCPQNEWGTADTGKGKACKNSRRLSLITEGDMEDVETAESAYLHIPVTSVKAWAGYVRQVADVLHKPVFAVVTTIRVVPDKSNQFKVEFETNSVIEDGDAIAALIAKHEAEKETMQFPYALVQVQEAPKPRGRAAAPAAVRGKVVAPVQAAVATRRMAVAAPRAAAKQAKY